MDHRNKLPRDNKNGITTRVYIPKAYENMVVNKQATLGIPAFYDRIVQEAVRTILCCCFSILFLFEFEFELLPLLVVLSCLPYALLCFLQLHIALGLRPTCKCYYLPAKPVAKC
jgi:hypothetical protein